MNYDAFVRFVQGHFTDGLALVIGSGLSSAEGIPGMPALAEYLALNAGTLEGADAAIWSQVKEVLDTNQGLEAALLKHAPTETLESWIAGRTRELLMPKEREIITSVLQGDRSLRLTKFLSRVLKPTNGLPILTPNYDRLIEVACEMAGLHVDTTAIGLYAGAFDDERSCMASCRGITTRGKTSVLDHFPRAIILKPHGSFDWYQTPNGGRRCSLDLDAERLMITPGINKYRAGYNAPFDKHRELANEHIRRAARLLVVGYGFNDDHLQTHIEERIKSGTPTLILNRTASSKVEDLAKKSPRCVCVSKPAAGVGFELVTNDHKSEHQGPNLWDLGVLTEELLT